MGVSTFIFCYFRLIFFEFIANGGGSSDIRLNANDISTRIVVAGGGGGASILSGYGANGGSFINSFTIKSSIVLFRLFQLFDFSVLKNNYFTLMSN